MEGGLLVPPAGDTNKVATLCPMYVVSGAPQTLSTGIKLLLNLNIVSLHIILDPIGSLVFTLLIMCNNV